MANPIKACDNNNDTSCSRSSNKTLENNGVEPTDSTNHHCTAYTGNSVYNDDNDSNKQQQPLSLNHSCEKKLLKLYYDSDLSSSSCSSGTHKQPIGKTKLCNNHYTNISLVDLQLPPLIPQDDSFRQNDTLVGVPNSSTKKDYVPFCSKSHQFEVNVPWAEDNQFDNYSLPTETPALVSVSKTNNGLITKSTITCNSQLFEQSKKEKKTTKRVENSTIANTSSSSCKIFKTDYDDLLTRADTNKTTDSNVPLIVKSTSGDAYPGKNGDVVQAFRNTSLTTVNTPKNYTKGGLARGDFMTPTKSSTDTLDSPRNNDFSQSTTTEEVLLTQVTQDSSIQTTPTPSRQTPHKGVNEDGKSKEKNKKVSPKSRSKPLNATAAKKLDGFNRFRSSSYHLCCEKDLLSNEQIVAAVARYKSMMLLGKTELHEPDETCETLIKNDYRFFSSCIQVKEEPPLTPSSSLAYTAEGRELKTSTLFNDESRRLGLTTPSQTRNKNYSLSCSIEQQLPNDETSYGKPSHRWPFFKGFLLRNQQQLDHRTVRLSMKQLSSRRIITKARSKWDIDRLKPYPFYQPPCITYCQKYFPWYKEMLDSGGGPWVSARSYEVPYRNIIPEVVFRWKNKADKSFLLLRLLLTALLFGSLLILNIISEASFYTSEHVPMIWDLLHVITVPINDVLQKNDLLFSIIILFSSFLMDAVVVLVWIQWALIGDSFRLPLAYALFYLLRAFMRGFCIFPYPEGYKWHVPAFNSVSIYSLSVPYQATNDFFFSGHVGCCVLASVEHYYYRFWWGFYFSVLVGLVEFSVLTLTRGHYTIDMFTGALMAHWTHLIARKLVRPIDQWLALPPRLTLIKKESHSEFSSTNFNEKRVLSPKQQDNLSSSGVTDEVCNFNKLNSVDKSSSTFLPIF